MSFSNYGRLRPQVRFLQRQFLQDSKLPFTDVLSEQTIEQALKALNFVWLDRVYSPLVTLWVFLGQARRKTRVKHGGELERVDLPEISAAPNDRELVLLDGALSRLATEDPLAAEIVQLKFFTGVGRESIAEMLGLSVHEVRIKWAYAQAWLKVELEN
jgi:hypothetical protein